MFSHLKYSAIAVGLFVLSLASIFAFLVTLFAVSALNSEHGKAIATIYMVFILVFRTFGFLAAGYISAKVAQTQPLLHAFICGVLGVLFNAFFDGSLIIPLLFGLPAVVTGGWLYKKYNNAI